MKLYPTIQDVFENPLEIYKTLFFPLVSIDLSTMNKGDGRVHFVSVLGNAYPYLICDDIHYGFDFIKFDWTGEKYNFDNSIFDASHFQTLLQWYAKIEQDYVQNKEQYLKTYTYEEAQKSHLVLQEQERKKISHDFYMYGQMLINYWMTRDKYLETGDFKQAYAYYGYSDTINKPILSLSKTGQTNRSDELVGKVCGYYYITYGEDEIKLSIDRKAKKIVQKFSWT